MWRCWALSSEISVSNLPKASSGCKHPAPRVLDNAQQWPALLGLSLTCLPSLDSLLRAMGHSPSPGRCPAHPPSSSAPGGWRGRGALGSRGPVVSAVTGAAQDTHMKAPLNGHQHRTLRGCWMSSMPVSTTVRVWPAGGAMTPQSYLTAMCLSELHLQMFIIFCLEKG